MDSWSRQSLKFPTPRPALVALLTCAACAHAGCAADPPTKLSVGLAKNLPSYEPPTPPLEPDGSGSDSSDGSADEARVGETVGELRDRVCSTAAVQGLSEQIIAEGNCMFERPYERLPKMDEVVLGRAVFPYLAAPARDALVKAVTTLAGPDKPLLKVNSMLRTVAQQYLLYHWYKRGRCGIRLASTPGKSNHETGLAIDISEPEDWRRRLSAQGFRWYGKKDRWHFDYVGPKATRHRGWDVKAFQRLWNANHPDDLIRDDGDWGPSTEAKLRLAPALGFATGASCAEDKK